MSNLDLFPLPEPCNPEQPMSELHIWQWAKTVERKDVNIFNYLASLGFVKGKHRITEEQYRVLNHACEYFHIAMPRIHTPRSFDELFTRVDSGGFYVQGRDGHYMPSDELVAAVVKSGWIYDVKPETTYFQVLTRDDGEIRLIAKYQQIIGSRTMCAIVE